MTENAQSHDKQPARMEVSLYATDASSMGAVQGLATALETGDPDKLGQAFTEVRQMALEGKIAGYSPRTGNRLIVGVGFGGSTSTPSAEETLTVKEAAALLAIPVDTLRSRIRHATSKGRRHPFTKIGDVARGRFIVRKSDLLEWAERFSAQDR